MKSNILIIGSGALATLFAARLSAVGLDVIMLGSWQEGLAALRKNGARLNGADGQIVKATDNPDDCQGVNYALVLIKSWQTERGASQLATCLANDGLALTLQNGLGNDLILSNLLGVRRVSRGVTTLGATMLDPGSVRSVGEGVITLERHPQLDGLVEMLRHAGFGVRIIENVEPFVWGKLVINAAINPLTAILRVKNGDLLTNPPAHVLMGQLASEVAKVAEALAVKLPFMDPNHAVDEVAQHTADNISSMLQDVLRGAPTEVEAINGAVVRVGEQKGISTPVNRTICSLVNALPVRGKI
ncbi:MAG: 2-dehydropantoate 2-reductase [Anaerolineales bacterium]|jgi:2-dehydropantoate 2-reductase